MPALPPGASGLPGDSEPRGSATPAPAGRPPTAGRTPGPPARPGPPKATGPRRPTALLLTSILGVLAAVLLFIFVIRVAGKPGSKVNLGSQTFNMGLAKQFAPEVVANGPLIFPPLHGGSITLYVQHLGSNPLKGWLAFNADPPADPPNCFVRWQPSAHDFVDSCTKARYPADGQGLTHYAATVDKSGQVIINLRQVLPATSTTTDTTSTTLAISTTAPVTTNEPATSAP